MSVAAVLTTGAASAAATRVPVRATPRVALLGTGTVGRAVLARLAQWHALPGGSGLDLVHVANSRAALADAGGLCPTRAAESFAHGAGGRASSLAAVSQALAGTGPRIVIDATASEEVAAQHARWLRQGCHVVTACKLGQGTALARWREIRAAAREGGAQYGDSATVGAGLPLLRSLRDLQAGRDRIHAIAGVLSGSLAWLFNHYDGMRPFSALVRQARELGYTEPDPRDDLSGEDVRRKLVILARAAGVELEPGEVDVESLVPAPLRALGAGEVDAALPMLDAPLRALYAEAYKSGARLRFLARLDCAPGTTPVARVGVQALDAGHPLAGGAGTDNRVAIWSDRYREQPLVIQGPGAGADVTAAALLDDALRIARAPERQATAACEAKNVSIDCGRPNR
jgi:homoserine dehydrogenase